MVYNFIHIPKTAGSALRVTLKNSNNKQIVYVPHGKRLNQYNNVIFVVRDPFERFCGAYYERKNTEAYKREYHKRKKEIGKIPMGAVYGGPLDKRDQALFADTETPNDLMNKLRKNQGKPHWLFSYPKTKGPTAQVFGAYTVWLGDLQKFKANQGKVKHAVDISVFTDFFKNEFNINVSQDKMLSRNLTENKDYNLSEENKEWYRTIRKGDFLVYEYIKTQDFYRS